jgi:4-amino-4-deoxy-L-arabinose transferase-like glycosyltransferase
MFALAETPKEIPHATAVGGPMPPLSPWLLGMLVLVAATWFLTLDLRHLLRSDEGRYAEIAREMFASGDWVTIRYQDLKYFEKPPLHLWMTALAYELFGVGEWQARLWVAISGAAGIGLVAVAAQRWFGAGLLAALALLAAPTWNIGSHFNSLDMGVSGALAAVLVCLLMAQHPNAAPASRRNWMWAAWAAMALAVLTKGLIGIVLPGIALVLYTLMARDWALWTRLYLASGTAVFLAITAPWFVLVSQRNPEFAQFFFIHEHWERYTSSVHQRGAPAWYFVPQLLAGFLPWLGLLPGMWRSLQAEPRQGFRPLLFCAVWAAGIFAFFSASGSKLPGYILPMFPALAFMAAAASSQLPARSWQRQLVFAAVLMALALLASPLLGRTGNSGAAAAAVLRSYGLWISAACALGLAGVAAAWLLNQRGARQASMAAYALSFFAATTVGLLGHETLGRPASGADLLPAIHKVLKPEMPIYSVRLLDHTLPFYLRRTTVMVEHPDELEFGTQREPQKWLPTLAAFQTAWASGQPALALMSPATFGELQAQPRPQPLTMYVVARDERRVVVANFAPPAP